MKHSKLLSVSILIVSALLLSGAKLGSVNAQSTSTTHRNKQQGQTETQPTDTSDSTPAPTSPIPSLTVPESPPQASDSEYDSENWSERLQHHIWPPLWSTFFPPIWSNWALVIAAAVAAGIAVRTLIAIRKSNMTALTVARATKVAAFATEQYVEMTRDMVEAAKQSAKAAALALNAERPYLFVEKQDVGMYLSVSLSIASPVTQPSPNVADDPQRYKGIDKADQAAVRLSFDLRNRGKGPAIVGSVRIRMLLGQGLVENTDFRLVTIGRKDAVIRGGVSLIGPNETAECVVFGLTLPLDLLTEIGEWKYSLRFSVLAAYTDVYDRRFYRSFPFEYRGPVKSGIGGIPPLGPMLIPAFKKRRRRYR